MCLSAQHQAAARLFPFVTACFSLLPTCSLSIVRLFIWDGLVGGSRVPVHSFNF